MGRGDKRTRKGKIFKGSYGKSRPHKVKKKDATAAKAAQGARARGA
jgi:30S ribosomal protein S31